MKDRAGRHRRPTSTPLTHPQVIGGAPKVGSTAARTDEPLRPAQLREVVQTGLVVGKPGQQLLVFRRVIDARFGMPAFSHKQEGTSVKQICRTDVRWEMHADRSRSR